MNVIKPKSLGILTRPFMVKGRRHLAVTTLAFFDMAAPDELLPDTALWPFVAEALGDAPLLDAGMPKERGEVVVEGMAMPADGVAVPAMGVRLAIGGVDKRLRVFGDRRWLRTRESGRFAISDPAPFTEMPLTLERAFGGPGFARNPAGKGHGAERRLEEGRAAALPNIGAWDAPLVEPGQEVAPATLGAIPYELPQRMGKAGTYDAAWLRDRFPGWADDVDWSLFNVAAPDQWIEGFWTGDEPFLVVGMSAGSGRREGRLPGIAARVFVERDDGERRLDALRTRLDTVWLFPNQGKGIVAHRAVARDLLHPDGADVTAVMLAWERLGEPPRPVEHYAEVFRLRTDPATRALYALADRQLVPEPRPAVAEARRAEKAAAVAAMRAEQDEKIAYFTGSAFARAGIPIPAGGLPAPPGPDLPVITPAELERGDADLAGLMAAVDALVEETRAEAERHKEAALEAASAAEAEARAELEALLEDGAPPPRMPGDPPRPEDLEQAMESARLRAVGPLPADGMDSVFDLDAMLAGLDAGDAAAAGPGSGAGPLAGLDDEARAAVSEAASGAAPGLDVEALLAGIPGAGAAAPPDRAALARRIDEARLQIRDGMHTARRVSPEPLAPAEPMPPEVSAGLGRLIVEELGRGTPFADRDLAGADLHGADLSGRDLQGALFERADLTAADLSGADGRKAVFTAARLAGARLSGARLAGANFSGADLAGADLSRADLSDALLTKATLAGANLAGARLSRVQALQASLAGADLSFCRGRRMLAAEADLSGVRAVGSRFVECVFLGADLSRADFLGADLEGSVLLNVKADGMRLSGARLARLMASGEGSFRRLTGIAMRAAGSGWRGACLAGADLTGARLDGSDLGGADLTGAVLGAASLVKALLSDADLTGAWLAGADLKEALLRGTRLGDATLVAASLYAAELTGAVLAGARLDGADIRLTALERRRA